MMRKLAAARLKTKVSRSGTTSIWYGLPFEQYTALPGANSSRFRSLNHSPRLYKNNRQEINTRSMSTGSIAHTALLEPNELASTYAPFLEGVRMDKRTKVYNAVVEEVKPATVVKFDEYQTAIAIVDEVRANKIAMGLLVGADCEVTVQWVDPDSGVLCKARFDAMTSNGIVDLKTTNDCTPEQFMWSAKKYGYWEQACHYTAGYIALQKAGLVDSVKHPTYHIIAAENGDMRASIVHELERDIIELFEEERSTRLAMIAKCELEGEWPGPDNSVIHKLSYPGLNKVIEDSGLEF